MSDATENERGSGHIRLRSRYEIYDVFSSSSPAFVSKKNEMPFSTEMFFYRFESKAQ